MSLGISNSMKKYKIIYADPPWSYNDKMSGHSFSLDHEYKTQDKNWIKNLPVKNISEKEIIKAQYEDKPITIMGMKIECAVLEDGTRVISQRGLNRALEVTEGGGARNLPRFLYLKPLEPFISAELRARVTNPIEYLNLASGTKAFGTPAEAMADICQVWIDASNAGVLTEKQERTATLARILQKGVGKIGWVALVDEASGFQKVRDNDNLEKLLSLYVAKEFLPYLKTFVEAFYEEIYRLKKWEYNPKKNKYQVVGKYTLKYVYGCLPSEVVEAVKKQTPRTKGGNYTRKLFQSLTAEVGKPHLDRALGGVIALLKSSATWGGFERAYARAYGEQKDQLVLPLSSFDE